MTPFKRTLRRCSSLFWTALTLVTVTLAVLVGLGKLLLPYSERYQPQLEQRLSEVLGRPVTVQQFSGNWKAFGPRLELEGVQIYSDDQAQQPLLHIDHAAVDIRPLAVLLPNTAAYQFTIIGADLQIVRDEEGKIRISGVGLRSSAESSMNLSSLSALGEISLERFTIAWDDAVTAMRAEVQDVSARVQFHKDSLSAEWQASVPGTGRAAAQITGAGRLQIRDGGMQSVNGWVAAEVTDLDRVTSMFPARWSVDASGGGSMQFWVDWDRQSGADVLGEVDLNTLQLQLHPDGEQVSAQHAAAMFRLRRQAFREWQLALTGIDITALGRQWQAGMVQVERSQDPKKQIWVVADGGDISFARPIVQGLMRRWRPANDKWVQAGMEGWLEHLELLLGEGWRPSVLRASGRELELTRWKNWPKMSGIAMSIEMLDGKGELSVSSSGVEIDWPRVFRSPVHTGTLNCVMDIAAPRKGEWQLSSDACRISNEAITARTSLFLEGNTDRPYMQARASIEQADLGKLGPYWADAIMSAEAVDWLRRGLVGGSVQSGSFSIDGDLDDWPFRNAEGTFLADFDVNNGVLDYAPGWPRATDIKTVVSIRNSLLEVANATGQIGAVPLDAASARVFMQKPVRVELDFEGGGSAAQLLDYVMSSPLDELMSTDLSPLKLSGPARAAGTLVVDGSQQSGKVQVNGTIQLDGANLEDARWDLLLEDIRGGLGFTEAGLEGSAIETLFKGHPAVAELQAGPAFAGNNSFRAAITGQFPVDAILSPRFENLALLTGELDGAANWEIETVVAKSGSGAVLRVATDLVGIRSDLPAPLAKTAGESLPLHLQLPLTGNDNVVQLNLAGLGSFESTIDRDQFSMTGGSFNFGDLPPAPLEEGYLRLSGRVESLDLDGWIRFMGAALNQEVAAARNLEMDVLALETGKLRLLDRDFAEVALQAGREEGRWRVQFDSETLAGTLVLPNAEQDALTADFDVLHIGEPAGEGLRLNTDPRKVPTLHLYARDLVYGKLHLGTTRLEAWPDGEGMHFESVESTSDQIAVRASGDWLVEGDGQQRSSFVINITSESLGGLLDSMGIDAAMSGGQTVVDLDAWWPGSPSAFSMQNVNGALSVGIIEGHIDHAQPGAGRLLGLISLQALPRRLAMDFRDVFASGLSFDQAAGSFKLSDGVASTDDFEVRSTAAVIKVSGATDLGNKAYDQVIVIEPGVGSTLPLIGAWALGPGGAAAGLALQGLLKKPLGRVVQVQYSLTGPWADPVIEPISAQQAPEDATPDTDTGQPGAVVEYPEPVTGSPGS